MKRLLCLVISGGVWIACANDASDRAFDSACQAGQTQPCNCAPDQTGNQSCAASNEWEACFCQAPPPPLAAADAATRCGDGRCSPDENCRTCAIDCGKCEKCDFAPSCDGALGAPASPTVRDDLSNPHIAGDAGAAPAPISSTSCLDPELRIRITKIRSIDGGGDVYCIVDAADGKTSEAAMTTKMQLDGGKEVFISQGQGTLWGQQALKPSTNNLTLTYNCYKSAEGGGAWSAALAALGSTATTVGGASYNPYGWAFGIGGAASNAAAAAITAANSKDQLRINWQQTISKDQLLDLTNGRTWTVMREDPGGVLGIGKWKWEITIQAWGCADKLSRPR